MTICGLNNCHTSGTNVAINHLSTSKHTQLKQNYKGLKVSEIEELVVFYKSE